MKWPVPKLTLRELQRGQSLVEMSLGFVLLLIVLSGLLDIGRAYYIYAAMEDGAGEAALYLSIDPECPVGPDIDPSAPLKCTNPNNAAYRAKFASTANIDWSNVQVVVAPAVADPSKNSIIVELPGGVAVAQEVKVTINYKYTLLSPFVPRFVGLNPITLTTAVAQTIIRVH